MEEYQKVLASSGQFYLTDEITPKSAHELCESLLYHAISHANSLARPTFTVNISSPGGEVYSTLFIGATIMRVREEFGISVNTRILGEAASGAAIVSQFGEERLASPSSSFMLHDMQLFFRSSGDRNHWHCTLAGYDKTAYQLANVMASRNTAGFNDPKWWMENVFCPGEVYWNAQEALALGLIDTIIGGLPVGARTPQPLPSVPQT